MLCACSSCVLDSLPTSVFNVPSNWSNSRLRSSLMDFRAADFRLDFVQMCFRSYCKRIRCRKFGKRVHQRPTLGRIGWTSSQILAQTNFHRPAPSTTRTRWGSAAAMALVTLRHALKEIPVCLPRSGRG